MAAVWGAGSIGCSWDLARGRLVYPGPLDATHAWAHAPDLAAALVLLAERRAELPAFAAFGFPGHAVTGRELCAAVMQAVGRELSIGGMPWRLLRLLSPFVPIYREVGELAYLWRVPHRIDGTRLTGAIGDIPHTPLRDTAAASLRELGAAGPR